MTSRTVKCGVAGCTSTTETWTEKKQWYCSKHEKRCKVCGLKSACEHKQSKLVQFGSSPYTRENTIG